MTILIVGAMDREIDYFKSYLINSVNYHQETVNNFTFYFGNIDNKNIILVKSGVGRVNSALLIASAKLKYEFDYCINIGIAGGLTIINKHDVVIGEKYVYGDVDLTALKNKYVYGQMSGCPLYFKANETLINSIKTNAKLNKDVIFGTICSAETFTVDINKTSKLINDHFKELNVYAFDMESTAFAQSCYELNIPFIAIRFISDIIGSVNQVEKFIDEQDEIAREKKNNEFVLAIIKAI